MIERPLESVWAVLVDSAALPKWNPQVHSVATDSSLPEGEGAVRRCSVSLNGKSGVMVERIAAFKPLESISYSVVEESFGFDKMVADFGFEMSIRATAAGTRVTSKTFYRPRNVLVRLLNALVLRRQMAGTVAGMLLGLKRYVESV